MSTQDKINIIQNSNLPTEVKNIGTLASFMGASDESILSVMGNVLNAQDTLKAEATHPKQPDTVEYDETDKLIVSMLQENTGTHFLDSGGAYGRSWERNRAITDFKSRPELIVNIDKYGIELSIDIFHYLSSFLSLNDKAKELQKEYEQFVEAHPDNYEVQNMEEFMDSVSPNDEMAHGLTNTYNYDNALNGTLQYGVFTLDGEGQYSDECYIILQIHGGCDVRGGYTDAKIFKLLDFDYFIMAQSDLNAGCQCGYCDAYSDDSGYHWYTNNSEVRQDENLGNHSKKIANIPIKETEFDERYKLTDDNKCICKRCKNELIFSAHLDF